MGTFQLIMNIGVPLFLVALGYGVGRYRERRHLISLATREADMSDIGVTNLKTVPRPEEVVEARFVCGQAVIATDYFKTFASRLRNLVGGRMRAYETLMERARREAMLRMLDEARAMGASEVWNIRLSTSTVGQSRGRQGSAMAEILAYGTAVVRKPDHGQV
ncbi:MAG: YbjQ family protein [Planctomycetes bacterium]|nr:YbjQ family protein [Planctomycetota bacterium]